MHVELREVLVCSNVMEAQIAKGVLEENNIEARIRKDDCGGMEPQLQITEGIKVLVFSDQYEEAKKLLQMAIEADTKFSDEDRPSWACTKCGEVLEAQFTDCWNCGTPKSPEIVGPGE